MWASQDKGTLQERCDATTVLLPLRSCTWFQTMLSNSWDDIVLTGLLIETTFTQVPNIHRSFVAWTGIEQCMPTTCVVPAAHRPLRPRTAGSPQRPDGFSGKSSWGDTPLHWAAQDGHVAAAELLLSKGAAVDAKTNDGQGPQSGKQGEISSLPDLGWFNKMLGTVITSGMLMNDQNAICPVDINFGKVVSFHSWKRNMSGTMITM